MLYNYQFERTLTDSERCNLFSVELYLASEVKKTVENAASTLKSKGTLDFLMFICTCIGKNQILIYSILFSRYPGTFTGEILQVHIGGKNTCQNHLVQTNIWVLFLYSQLQSMAYSFIQLALIRDCVCPSTINTLEFNQFLLSSNFGGFHFLSWNSHQMPIEERNIKTFVLFEFVNMYPTWFTSIWFTKYTMFTLFQHNLCTIWKDELFKHYGVQK